VNRNQNQLGLVDLSQLFGITYTTQLLNNGTSAIVIAGVGKHDANDIDLISGLDRYSQGMAFGTVNTTIINCHVSNLLFDFV
jgi:hypothetical protein